MICLWLRGHAKIQHTMMPTSLVGLRNLKWIPSLSQTISAVGISRFRTIGELKRGFLRDSGSRVAFSSGAAGIRHLSNSRMATRSSRAATTIGDGLHRQRQNNKYVGVSPSGVTRRFDPRSESNNECVVSTRDEHMGATIGWATRDYSFKGAQNV